MIKVYVIEGDNKIDISDKVMEVILYPQTNMIKVYMFDVPEIHDDGVRIVVSPLTDDVEAYIFFI